MRGEFQRRYTLKRLATSPLALTALVLLLVLVGQRTWDIYHKARVSGANRERTEQAFESLAERQEFLEKEIESLSTDVGVETALRKRFGVARAGEGVVILLDEAEHDATETDGTSLWQRFLNIFH